MGQTYFVTFEKDDNIIYRGKNNSMEILSGILTLHRIEPQAATWCQLYPDMRDMGPFLGSKSPSE